jgi:hypothetical protein
MADENKNTKKVVKSVTGKKYTEDENKQHKLLLGLGCALITAGAALTGWAGDKVRTCESRGLGMCFRGNVYTHTHSTHNPPTCWTELGTSIQGRNVPFCRPHVLNSLGRGFLHFCCVGCQFHCLMCGRWPAAVCLRRQQGEQVGVPSCAEGCPAAMA